MSVGVGGIVRVFVGMTVVAVGRGVFVGAGTVGCVGVAVGTGGDVGRGVLFGTGKVAVYEGLGVGLRYGIGVGGK